MALVGSEISNKESLRHDVGKERDRHDILCTWRTQWRTQLLNQLQLRIITKGPFRWLLQLARTIPGGERAKHIGNGRLKRSRNDRRRDVDREVTRSVLGLD